MRMGRRALPSRERSFGMSDRGRWVDAELVHSECIGVRGLVETTIAFAGRESGVRPAVFDGKGSAPTVSGEHPGGLQLGIRACNRACREAKVACKLADGGKAVTPAQHTARSERRDLGAQLFIRRDRRLRIDFDYQATARGRRKSVVQARRRSRNQQRTDIRNATIVVTLAALLTTPELCARQLDATHDSTSQAKATPIPPSRLTQLVRTASRAVRRSSSSGCGRCATHCVATREMTTTRSSTASKAIR